MRLRMQDKKCLTKQSRGEERVKVVWSRIYVWPHTDDIELEQREPIWHLPSKMKGKLYKEKA